MITVTYKTGTVHIVLNADGGPHDGSLFSFYTYCGRQIVDLDAWREHDQHPTPTCQNCLRRVPATTRPEPTP